MCLGSTGMDQDKQDQDKRDQDGSGQNGQAVAYVSPPAPEVRPVSFGDITDALKLGFADFRRAPLYGLFFGGCYTLGGLFIMACLSFYDMPWMILPVAIGFPLIGPFIAVGLYEISRRLAAGTPLYWREIVLVVIEQRDRQLGAMAFVVLFVFWIWIYQVRLLLALFYGLRPIGSLEEFALSLLNTSEGIGFLAVGTIVGALLAAILFCATVISIPLLLDRDIDFVTALITSFKSVFKSPVVMLSWGVIVTVSAIIAMLPAFLGLLVVLPVLGHATWHLYQRTIVAVR